MRSSPEVYSPSTSYCRRPVRRLSREFRTEERPVLLGVVVDDLPGKVVYVMFPLRPMSTEKVVTPNPLLLVLVPIPKRRISKFSRRHVLP